ncbi:MAG: hypothetical protein HQ557_15300 [Bacteroidetes bacterium]|nr:hypothetical protein [Bacteroidota bacterium]
MKLEVLGSGGAVITPKPLCSCSVCREAREKGQKYSRLGPSVFIHGPNILIDTPEDISTELNRSNINNINACFYSHWHPDHTAGKRIFEMNMDWLNNPPNHKKTKVILTESIADTFKSYMSIMNHFEIFIERGIIELDIIKNNQEIKINSYIIKPVQLAENYVFGYEIRNEKNKILVVMDELKNWNPDKEIKKTYYDLVYLPFGVFDFNPITNIRRIKKDNPLLLYEQTIDETIELIKVLNTNEVILSHIEEPYGISIDLAENLSKYYSGLTGKKIQLAFDSLMVEIE